MNLLLLILLTCACSSNLDGGFMIGRVTDSSATVSIRPLEDLDAIIAWGDAPGIYTESLGPYLGLQESEFYTVKLGPLHADHTYYFQMATRRATGGAWLLSEIGSFHTARPSGSCFRAAFMSDSHLIPNIGLQKYRNVDLHSVTLSNISNSGSDFLMSLGDFAHCECYMSGVGDIETMEQGIDRYMTQRRAMEAVCRDTPFFMALGNHEGEQGWTAIKDMAYQARNYCIMNPNDDGFYSAGPRKNYYAWEWGSALFVVLDPFTYTMECPHNNDKVPGTEDGWTWTLGKTQYDWLWSTLQSTTAKWKIICIHHLASTTDDQVAGSNHAFYGRGGIEIAKSQLPSFEWGGEDKYGQAAYSVKRPGWAHGPIHDMLVESGHAIVLHGHDHSFVYQVLDGVKYILCPQTSDAGYSLNASWLNHGGYSAGTFIENSGYVTLDISTFTVIVRYWRSFLPGEGLNNSIAFEKFLD